ncbi:hypothetical protein HanRHA438_Chr17g0840771 [Helianthus annuus]|nr:hypothetical protein HanRHA438_Chr17g0840771 [Helianthus annuus]
MPSTFWPERQPESLLKVSHGFVVWLGRNDGGIDEMLGKKLGKAVVEDEKRKKKKKMRREKWRFGYMEFEEGICQKRLEGRKEEEGLTAWMIVGVWCVHLHLNIF